MKKTLDLHFPCLTLGGSIILDIELSNETYKNLNQLTILYMDGRGDLCKE